MPTSNEEARRDAPAPKRSLRYWALSALAILAVVVAADVALCLVLEPYGAHSEIVWSEYRKTEQVQTLLFGSSTTAYNMDPTPFDEVLSTHTFNLSTPGQSLDNTLNALRAAAEEHDLERAIICVGHETMVAPPYINAALAFTQNKCMGESPAQALADVGDLVFNKAFFPKHYSLTCAFPWVYNHVELTAEDIADNVYNRLHYDVVAAGERYAKRLKTSEWLYRSQGYGGVHYALSPGTPQHGTFVSYEGAEPYEDNFESLRAICAYCRERGIHLYVVGSPYRYSAVLQYGDAYRKTMTRVRDMVEGEGAQFFDLNFIHRDLLNPKLNDYCDTVHLSAEGSPVASRVVAQLVARIEAGQDIRPDFYDYTDEGWQAFVDDANFVDSVDFDAEIAGDVAQVVATARTGSTTPVEYRLDVRDDATGEWHTERAYASDATFTVQANGSESLSIRIYARATTGDQDQDRWVEGTLLFEDARE